MKIRRTNRAALKHFDFKIPEYLSSPAECPTPCCLFTPVTLTGIQCVNVISYFPKWKKGAAALFSTFANLNASLQRTVKFSYLLLTCSVPQSCPTLWDPMDCRPPGSSVHGILQASILEWVAISFSRGSSQPRDQNHVFALTGSFFTTESPGKLYFCVIACN